MTCSCPGCLSCLCGGNFWPSEAILANTTLKGLWVTGNVAGKRVFRWLLRWVLGGKQEGLVAKALETETTTESLQRLRLWKCIYSGNGSNSCEFYIGVCNVGTCGFVVWGSVNVSGESACSGYVCGNGHFGLKIRTQCKRQVVGWVIGEFLGWSTG